ncbi:2774_t:CDS:1, partial [Racocetra persica]
LINIKFKDSEKNADPVKFFIIVKLERELVNKEMILPEVDQYEDTEFHEI